MTSNEWQKIYRAPEYENGRIQVTSTIGGLRIKTRTSALDPLPSQHIELTLEEFDDIVELVERLRQE